MNNLILFLLCISGLMCFRAFSFAITHVSMYSYRDSMCIERIVKEQKACDFLNASYQFMITLMNLCLISTFIFMLCESNFINICIIASLIIVMFAYLSFFFIKIKLENKHNLYNFYNQMIEYRSKQKVVTKDNDNEVSFIKSYKKTLNQKIKINCWLIISFIILLWLY